MIDLDKLKKYKNILISTNKNPDMDGYSCICAYSDILRKKHIKSKNTYFGILSIEANYILKKFKIKPIQKNISSDKFDAIVQLDGSTKYVIHKSIDPKKIIQIIDHHKDAEHASFPNAEIIYEPIGALATYFVELYLNQEITIPKHIGILLYAAIISNTVNLKNFVTTKRDINATQYLEKYLNINRQQLAIDMFKAKSELASKKLPQDITSDQIIRIINNKKIFSGQLEIIDCEKLIKNRKADILLTLNKIKDNENLDHTFISLVGMKNEYNIICAIEPKTQKILSSILNIKFENNIARTKKIWMRKEIIPKLKKHIESQ